MSNRFPRKIKTETKCEERLHQAQYNCYLMTDRILPKKRSEKEIFTGNEKKFFICLENYPLHATSSSENYS